MAANKKTEVYLRPCEIRYSQISISDTFQDGTNIGELLDDLFFGRCFASAMKLIEVTQVKGQWYSADNRRLWVFKTLESVGKLDRVQVKVKKWIPQGKMTTKDNGKTVRIRGGDPGGQVWKAIQELDKENTPKKRKRKRKRNRGKKKKQAIDSRKVSDTRETVDKSNIHLGETQSSENNDDCDIAANTAEEAISFASLHELNGMIQNVKSFGHTNVVKAPSEDVVYDSSDESDEDLEEDSGVTEDTQATQEAVNDVEEFSNESLYDTSEDETAAECFAQTTTTQAHIHSHNIGTFSSNGIPNVYSKSQVSEVPQISRNVTNNVHYRPLGRYDVPLIQRQQALNDVLDECQLIQERLKNWVLQQQRTYYDPLLQRQRVQNEPLIQRECNNDYSTIQPRRNADHRPDNGKHSYRERVLQCTETSEVTTFPYRRENRFKESGVDNISRRQLADHDTPGLRGDRTRIPNNRNATHKESSNGRISIRHQSSDIDFDMKTRGDRKSLGKPQHDDWLDWREPRCHGYPGGHVNSRKPYKNRVSIASISDSDSDSIDTPLVDDIRPRDTSEAKSVSFLGKVYDKVSCFLSSVFN